MILGGYGVFGAGDWAAYTFSGLPPHWSFDLNFEAYFIDKWSNNQLRLTVDGTTYHVDPYTYSSSNGYPNLCGPSYGDWEGPVSATQLPHNSTTMTLNFTSNLTQSATTASWGIKDITLTVNLCASQCATCYNATASDCYSCVSGYFLSGNTCGTTCPTGTYKNSTTNTCASNKLKLF